MKLPSALETAGISPAMVAEWRAKGFGKSSPRPVDKSGNDATAEANVLSRWINVTPAMAINWLKNNFSNRPVADDVVQAYARDMVNNVWQPTHQGIAFNDEDRLIDGQHRLRAVVLAKKTIRMMVTFGLPAKIEGSEMTVMDCVDRGRTRSVADQLKIQHGLKNGTQIAQITAALAGLCHERIRRPSVDQTLKIYREFAAGMDYVITHRSKQNGLRSAGVLAGFAFAAQADDACLDWGGKVLEMFISLIQQNKPETYPAVQLLREFLTGQDATLILSSLNRGIAELTVQAIYLDLKGQRVEKLEFCLDGVKHFRAEQPERCATIAALFKLPAAEVVGTKVEPVTESHSGTLRTPAQPAPPAADRPTVEKILSKCESHFKLSRFIITGRGKDMEIDSARIVFIYLARSVGHTAGVVAAALKRTEDQIRDLTIPLAAMSSKQKKSVEALKEKL